VIVTHTRRGLSFQITPAPILEIAGRNPGIPALSFVASYRTGPGRRAHIGASPRDFESEVIESSGLQILRLQKKAYGCPPQFYFPFGKEVDISSRSCDS